MCSKNNQSGGVIMFTKRRKKTVDFAANQITHLLMNAKSIALGIFMVMIGFSTVSMATDNPGGIGGLDSLRGSTELEATRPADPLKKVSRQVAKLDNNFVGQPPMVPHSIRNYEISTNANKCLSCHSWQQAHQSGAVKISVTHFQDREGLILPDVSPRRYFCLQCHVPQVDAKPLIANDFKPVESLKKQ